MKILLAFDVCLFNSQKVERDVALRIEKNEGITSERHHKRRLVNNGKSEFKNSFSNAPTSCVAHFNLLAHTLYLKHFLTANWRARYNSCVWSVYLGKFSENSSSTQHPISHSAEPPHDTPLPRPKTDQSRDKNRKAPRERKQRRRDRKFKWQTSQWRPHVS